MLSRGCAETLTLLGCVLQSCSLTDQGRNSAAHIHKTSGEERQTCLIDLKEIHGHLKREFFDELRWKKKKHNTNTKISANTYYWCPQTQVSSRRAVMTYLGCCHFNWTLCCKCCDAIVM